MEKNKYRIFVLVLLLLGLIFRFYKPGLYIFGFDQVQILTNAESIVQGDMTLIGPRTGPADMFTGPLVYYITALFLFLLGSPLAIIGMSALISLATGVSIYFLSKKYLSIKSAIVMLPIWTFSPFLMHFDRIAWNPNLSFLASALVFFPMLGIMKERKASKVDLFYIALGSFLGFQAHFSGLLLPFMLLTTLLLFKRFSFPAILASGLGLISSILPTVLFDARNNWLNTRGLISFISEKESVGGTLFFDRFIHSLKTTLEIFGSLVPFQLERQVSIYLGLLLIVILLWQFAKKYTSNRTNTAASLFWVLAILLIFSLYRSNSPEYYFFIYLPAIFVFVSDIITPLLNKITIKKELVVLSLMALSLYTISNFESIAGRSSLKIENQQNLARDIAAFSIKTPVSMVAYDILEVDTLGMRYFIDRYVQFSDDGKTIHITHIDDKNSRYGSYGLWIDPRTNPSYNYALFENIVLQTPGEMRLLEDRYLGSKFGPFQTFQVVVGSGLTGDLLVVVSKIDNPFITGNGVFKALSDSSLEPIIGTDWKPIAYEEYRGYVKQYERYSLVYVTEKIADEFLEIVVGIDGINIKPGLLK